MRECRRTRVRFPAAPLETSWSEPPRSGQFPFSSTSDTRLAGRKTQEIGPNYQCPQGHAGQARLLKRMDPLQQRGRPAKGNSFHDRIWQPAVKRTWSSVDEEDPTIDNSVRILRPRIHDLRHTCATWLPTSRPDARLMSSNTVSVHREPNLGYAPAIQNRELSRGKDFREIWAIDLDGSAPNVDPSSSIMKLPRFHSCPVLPRRALTGRVEFGEDGFRYAPELA